MPANIQLEDWKLALLAAIVESSDDAIISKDLNGIITSWNRGAERVLGYSEHEIVGKSINLLIPADRLHEERNIIEKIRQGERIDHFETVRRRKNGEEIAVSLTISPVKNRQGDIVGASKILRDISGQKAAAVERQQLLDSERQARAGAEKASRLKDDFLATLSHELRTPLNAIVGWVEVLKETPNVTEPVRQGIEVIERNALAQAQLIDDLIEISRIAAGKVRLDVQPLDISEVVMAAVETIRPAADARQVQIRTTLSSITGQVAGDRSRLQQIVWNLLSNAVKFVPKKSGWIHISVARVKSHVEIAVTDNGPGIPNDFLPFIFDRFRQADSSTTRENRGLGIGLSIVKQLTEMHGGEVRVRSTGEGSTFTVSIPLVPIHHEDARHATGEKMAVDEAPGANSLSGIRVLVVDDEADSAGAVELILRNNGAEAKSATSVAEALQVLETFHPDVLLSDIGMPGQDGFELIRRVRSDRNRPPVPAVALTAFARSEDRTRILRAGFQSHLAKPVRPAELVATVTGLSALKQPRP